MSQQTLDPGSLIRGIACEKHDLVTAIIACPRCMDELLKERDEARALCDEASRQRDGWREKYQSAQARIDEMDNSDLEPSRLEIAARVMQGMLSCGGWDATRVAHVALQYADELIAAAKEVAK